MAIPKPKPYPRMTVPEYFSFERASETKHEYHDGVVLDMAGTTIGHALITSNLARIVGNALLGKPCNAYSSDLKIWIHRRRRYLYPDQSVICGTPAAPSESGGEAAENAKVIFEVLSPSSAAYDRGAKFKLYKYLDSLEEYVVIEQDVPSVDVFRRHKDGTWAVEEYSGMESVAELKSLSIHIRLADLYANVKFPEPGEEPAKSV